LLCGSHASPFLVEMYRRHIDHRDRRVITQLGEESGKSFILTLKTPSRAADSRFMGSRAWRILVLVGLVAVLLVLVARIDFSKIGAAPAAPAVVEKAPMVPTLVQTEELWTVSEVARDLLRMCVYASRQQAAEAMRPTATVTAVEGQPAVYDVQFRMEPGEHAQASTIRITLPHGLWTPDDYVPLVGELLRAVHAPTASASASTSTSFPTPPSTSTVTSTATATAEDPALLAALLDLQPSTITREDAAISQRLGRNMFDARAHEDAALLLGAFALREAAGRFSDWRDPLTRMTAHLAMASALSSSQSVGYGLSGRYADILRQIMECRAASALARLDAIEASGTSGDPQATWSRVLRMRATLDWRVSMNVHRDSLLERLEFFRMRTETITSQSVLNALTDDELSSQADWGRLTLHNDFGVETGNRVMPGLLSRELREINDVERGTPDAPTQSQTLGAALNNGANGCVSTTGVHVIGWGTWSRFFQRHLANYVYRVDNYHRYF